MEKNKILISLQDSGGYGGAENFLIWLADALEKQSVKTDFMSVTGSEITKHIKKHNAHVYETSVRMDILGGWKGFIKFFVYLIPTLYQYFTILVNFKNSGGNLIIISGMTDKFLLSPLARILGIKVLWIEFASPHLVLRRNMALPLLLYYLTLPLAEKIIVPSKNTQSLMIEKMGISQSRLELIYCGIPLMDKNILSAKKLKGASEFKKLGIDKKFVVGMVSRLEYGKGQDELINTAKILKKHIRELQVVIIGEGEERKKLESLIKKHKLTKTVKLLGFVDDARSLASNFDVFVFPSRWNLEGFGLVAVEAMMLEVPLVASNKGPVPEVVGNAGLIVEPDAENIAKAVLELYKSPQKRKKLIELGKKRKQNFLINEIAKQYKQEFLKSSV